MKMMNNISTLIYNINEMTITFSKISNIFSNDSEYATFPIIYIIYQITLKNVEVRLGK